MSNATPIKKPFIVHCHGGAADGAELPLNTEPNIGQILQVQEQHGIVASPTGQRIAERTWTTHLYKYNGLAVATPLAD
jgi:hypothetical protein